MRPGGEVNTVDRVPTAPVNGFFGAAEMPGKGEVRSAAVQSNRRSCGIDTGAPVTCQHSTEANGMGYDVLTSCHWTYH